jgi:L-malate glycosyltransferase
VSQMKRVLIIQSQMKQYRVPFFAGLHRALALDGIALRVAYSDPSRREARKGDNRDLPAEYGLKVRGVWMCRDRVLFQSVLKEVMAADLVIIEQANKYVWTHLLLALSILRLKKVAFWGHGRNRQARQRGLSEWLKMHSANCVAWWFAYTEGTAHYLAEKGVPSRKITIVQNAVDTAEFRRQLGYISDKEIEAAHISLGIGKEAKIGLFCASVIPDKLPDFLVASAHKIKQTFPAFELIVVGGGPEHHRIADAARQAPWIHCVGPKFGREKALYFRMADTFLMPGLVGLAILDAFTAGLPIITSAVPFHSPEIEYLEEGQNGVITPVDSDRYAEAVVRILSDEDLLRRLSSGALASAAKYTMEEMVARFRSGILQCLAAPSAQLNDRAPSDQFDVPVEEKQEEQLVK